MCFALHCIALLLNRRLPSRSTIGNLHSSALRLYPLYPSIEENFCVLSLWISTTWNMLLYCTVRYCTPLFPGRFVHWFLLLSFSLHYCCRCAHLNWWLAAFIIVNLRCCSHFTSIRYRVLFLSYRISCAFPTWAPQAAALHHLNLLSRLDSVYIFPIPIASSLSQLDSILLVLQLHRVCAVSGLCHRTRLALT